MNIDPSHLAAVAAGLIIGALIVYTACPRNRTEPEPERWLGEWTPREKQPLAPPAPHTERLQLWTCDFEFIEELPLDVRRGDEGLIRLPIGSSAERRLYAAFRTDELVWLTVNGPRGQWIGWSIRVHWDSELPASRDFEFWPAPDWATVWVEWSA